MAIGAFLAGLATVLFEIAGIGASIGIPYATEILSAKKNVKNNVDPVSMINQVDTLLSQIKNKSMVAYNKAIKELNNIPTNIGSPAYQEKLRKMKREANDKVEALEKKVNNIETDYNKVVNKVNAYAYQPATFKNTELGRKQAQDIVDQAKDLYKKYETRVSETQD